MVNKKELIAEVAQTLSYTKKDTEDVINCFIDTIVATLEKGEKVVISGFGTFDVKKREARKIPNPQTGETMNIPEKKVVSFKIAKAIREDLD